MPRLLKTLLPPTKPTILSLPLPTPSITLLYNTCTSLLQLLSSQLTHIHTLRARHYHNVYAAAHTLATRHTRIDTLTSQILAVLAASPHAAVAEMKGYGLGMLKKADMWDRLGDDGVTRVVTDGAAVYLPELAESYGLLEGVVEVVEKECRRVMDGEGGRDARKEKEMGRDGKMGCKDEGKKVGFEGKVRVRDFGEMRVGEEREEVLKDGEKDKKGKGVGVGIGGFRRGRRDGEEEDGAFKFKYQA